MEDAVTPSQRAMIAIWNSPGSDELVDILATQPAARAASLVAEIASQGSACQEINQGLAERLHQMSEGLEKIHSVVKWFSEVVDLRGLANLLRQTDLIWHPSFRHMVDGFALDFASRDDRETSRKLQFALCIHQSVREGFKLIEQLPNRAEGEVWDYMGQNQILCDSSFHEILDLAVKMAQKAKHPGIEDMHKMKELIIHHSRIRERYHAQRDAIPDEEGRISMRLPITPDEASVWFRLIPGISEVCERLAPEVARGLRSFEDAAALAVAEVPPQVRCSRAETESLAMTCLCEHVLWLDGHTRTKDTLVAYRGVLESQYFKELSDEAKGICTLHYSMALQRTWRECDDPQPLLLMAVDLLKPAIDKTDPHSCPRLLRDLYFTRARHLENLAQWSSDYYAQAEQDYEAGLGVSKVAHEVEARAMALSDLANTLRRRHAGEMAKYDPRIVALYEEASNCVSSKATPLTKSLVLNNFATYFNERLVGEQVRNEERSLALAAESVSALEGLGKENPMNRLEKINLASAYNTKANILRHRTYGNKQEQLQEAKTCYEAAIALVDPGVQDELLATLWLNLGQLQVDLVHKTGNENSLHSALESFSKAEGFSLRYPQQAARVAISISSLALERGNQLDRQSISQSIDSIVGKLHVIAHSTNPGDLARANLLLGQLYKQRSEGQVGTDLDQALACFSEAYSGYRNIESLELAIWALREAADCHITSFLKTKNRDSIRCARTFLTDAAELVETMWKKIDSIEWHQEISAFFSDIYGELAWCDAMGVANPYEVLLYATKAKGREISEQVSVLSRNKKGVGTELAGYLDTLRIQERLGEIWRWEVQRRTENDTSILVDLESADRIARDARNQRKILEGSYELRDLTVENITVQVKKFLKSHAPAAICDLTVCRWGTTVVFHSEPTFQANINPRVFVTPLTRQDLDRLLWDCRERLGWNYTYQLYISSDDEHRNENREAWADATDELLLALARNAMLPVLNILSDQSRDHILYIVAGVLAGIPIHAIPLPCERYLCEAVKGLAYVPSLTMLTDDKPDWKWPNAALCVLSDPQRDPKKQLRAAPSETACTANRLDLLGCKVTVVAAVANEAGPDIFAKRGIRLSDTVTVLHDRPTPEWLSAHACEFDHIFYAGHGVGASATGSAGLLVLDAEGNETAWTTENVLATRELRLSPMVFLSTCETARDVLASTGADLFSFASCILRIGGGLVIGSVWLLRDDSAQIFTDGFYDGLAETWDPAHAFCHASRYLKQHLEQSMSRPNFPEKRRVRTVDWAGFMPFLSF